MFPPSQYGCGLEIDWDITPTYTLSPHCLLTLPVLCLFLLSPDVCNSTDLPEVEIISLLEEQLPHYKLRADTIYGYDHDDWLHTPLVAPDSPSLDLTTEQIEETLKYFREYRDSLYTHQHVQSHTSESTDTVYMHTNRCSVVYLCEERYRIYSHTNTCRVKYFCE